MKKVFENIWNKKNMFSAIQILRQAIIVFACFFFISCATNMANTPPEGATSIKQVTQNDAAMPYSIGRGDQLDIKFYYNNELNEKTVVRPDGMISLQLVGDVPVLGKTPSELKKILVDKYSTYLVEPEIAVIVQNFGSMVVYVGGEVNVPGMVDINGQTTIIQAVFGAGGLKDTAQKKQVVLLRNSAGEKPIFSIVDLNDILNSPTSKMNAVLKPNDIIYIPKTKIALANQFVDEYFTKLIPISKNVGFNWVRYLNSPD